MTPRFLSPVTRLSSSSISSAIPRAVVDERLSEVEIKWSQGACVCVVMASEGYPESYAKGKEITFGELDEGVVICHAGTAMKDGKLVTSGGRVLGVCVKGESLEDARKKAYANVEKIHFDGAHYRKDIGIKYRDIVKE